MAQRLEVQYIRAYTDGSAARKIAPMAPLKTMKLPKIKKHNKITVKIDPIAIGSILMSAFLAITLAVHTFSAFQRHLRPLGRLLLLSIRTLNQR